MTSISEEFSLEEMVLTMPYTQEEIDNFRDIAGFEFDNYEMPEIKTTESNQNSNQSDLPDDVENVKTILLRVEEPVYNLWKEWLNKVNVRLGYDSANKAFEIAVVEALNLPDDHLN